MRAEHVLLAGRLPAAGGARPGPHLRHPARRGECCGARQAAEPRPFEGPQAERPGLGQGWAFLAGPQAGCASCTQAARVWHGPLRKRLPTRSCPLASWSQLPPAALPLLPQMAGPLVTAARDRGLIVITAGKGDIVRLVPPLIVRWGPRGGRLMGRSGGAQLASALGGAGGRLQQDGRCSQILRSRCRRRRSSTGEHPDAMHAADCFFAPVPPAARRRLSSAARCLARWPRRFWREGTQHLRVTSATPARSQQSLSNLRPRLFCYSIVVSAFQRHVVK